MSTSNTDSRAPEVRLVSLSEIRLADGANPRRRFDEQALNELAASIGQHGVLQPLVVSSEDGGYTLIAGERRYRAAKLAGLTQVPVSIHDAGAQAIELAVDENLHRQDLDPVEEAHAFQAILQSGRLTKKQLAERVSKSAQYVNERLRLLELPEPIQQAVAAGTIPVRLAKPLIAMAKISEPVAVSCVALVAKGVAEVADLEERPERVIGCLGDHQWPDPQPIALTVSSYQHYQLADLPLPDGCDDIRERVEALGEPAAFRFAQEEADAARSYGCLLECKHDRFWSSAFITDPAFIADRVRLQLDQLEKQAKRRQREAERQQPPHRRERRRRGEGAAAPGTPATSRGEGGRHAPPTSSSAASCSSATTRPRSPRRSRSCWRC